ncbi:MAG: hypothetical protein M3Z06_16575, partial [Actinomycetota bacterium]|nr:hypothetical protein [Actinomycetota bacterium]
GVIIEVRGHGGALDPQNGNLYMALALRNGGTGLAVIHGWAARTGERGGTPIRPPLSDFRRQQRDLYIPVRDLLEQGSERTPGRGAQILERGRRGAALNGPSGRPRTLK